MNHEDWQLTAYALGDLDDAERASVAARLAHDPAARAHVDAIRRDADAASSSVRAWHAAAGPPAGMRPVTGPWDAPADSATASGTGLAARAARIARPRRRWRPAAFTFAAAAVALFAAWLATHDFGGDAPQRKPVEIARSAETLAPTPPARAAPPAPEPTRYLAAPAPAPPSPSLAAPAAAPPTATHAEPVPIGWVAIKASPWAKITVDGIARGTTPQRLALLPGRHTITFERGDRVVTRVVEVTLGDDIELYVDMSAAEETPKTGKVVVRVRPWAHVSIDGRRVGTSPLDLDLPAGTHIVRLTRGETVIEHTVRVVAGETAHVNADMDRIER